MTAAIKAPRRFQRTTFKGKVLYGPVTPSFPGVCMCIGMGGMYVISDRVFPPSVHLLLSFDLPGLSGSIEARGLVVYVLRKGEGSGKCRGPGMGIKFIEMTPQVEKLVHDYVVMKGRVLRELRFLLTHDRPPMKRINDLLTSTYITDYSSLTDLRRRVDAELSFLKVGVA